MIMYPTQYGLNNAVKKYILTSRKEIDLMLEWATKDGLKEPKNQESYPNPSSTFMWFRGLEKYGKIFATREAELREVI